LTLDRVILHTVLHHSSTSTYVPDLIEIEETFRGQKDVRTHERTDGRTFETGFIRSTPSKSRPKKQFKPPEATKICEWYWHHLEGLADLQRNVKIMWRPLATPNGKVAYFL